MGGEGGPCQELFDLGEKIAEEKKSSRRKSGAPEAAGTARGKGRKPPEPHAANSPLRTLALCFYRYFVTWLLRAQLPRKHIAVNNNNLCLSSLKIKTSFKLPRWTVIKFFPPPMGADFACVAYCVGSLLKIFYSVNTHFIF